MKQLIFFKTILLIVFVLCAGIVIVGCRKDSMQAPASGTTTQQAGQTSKQANSTSSNERIYLDLTKDQIIVGGITESMLQKYIDKGYRLGYLKGDLFAYQVSFKNNNGMVYHKDGWLKKGTPCLVKPDNPFIIRQGGNSFTNYGSLPDYDQSPFWYD